MRAFSGLSLLLALGVAASSVQAQHLRSLGVLDSIFSGSSTTRTVDDKVCKYSLSSRSCVPSDVCSYQYKFGDLNLDQSCRVKKSEVGTTPQQVHLAYASPNPGSAMTISWTTFVKVNDPAVWIGSSATSLKLSTAQVTTTSYYKDDTYALYIYHVTVSGFTPRTTYSYQVGSLSSAVDRTAVATFTTARAVNDKSEFEVAFIGDMGVDGDAPLTADYINSKLLGKVDFLFHVGDISYADNAGLLTGTEIVGFFYEESYNKFFRLLAPFMAQTPYMVIVGNHEAECHSAQCLLSSSKKDQLGNYQAYNTRFKMPSAESGGVKNMWYSFDHGPVHFTAISSETDYTGAPSNSYTGRTYGNFGNQLAWLEADLKKANANRANTPWLVVTMHRPMYTRTQVDEYSRPNGEAAPVQQAFEDLFIKYKVDVVISGHVHHYERQLPIIKNIGLLQGVSADRKTYTKPFGPVYIINGAAANNEGHEKYDASKECVWNVFTDNTNWGVSKLRVSRTSLRWQFVSAAKDVVLDEFVITK